MGISRDADRIAKDRAARSLSKLFGRYKVATTSPFTVYLDGSTTAVPALKVTGLSYSVGDTGTYLLQQGQLPVCLPTTT